MRNVRLVLLVAISAVLASSAASAQTQEMQSCTSSIRVLFDQYGMTDIPAGDVIWFTGVLKAVRMADGGALTTPVTMRVQNARITFGRWPYVITLPNSTMTLDPSITVPRRLWYGPTELTVGFSPAQVAKEALFDALPYTAPEPFIPRQSGPVTWTATFTASRPGITVDWAWSAAAYSQFGPVGSFRLKPLSGPLAEADPQAGAPDIYENDDPAGTAEAYKQYVVAGAMGSGAPQYTGTRSDTATVTACQASISPPQPSGPSPEAYRFDPRHFFPMTRPWMSGPVNNAPPNNTSPFASPVSQNVAFTDGSIAQAVDRCFSFDLCAQITYSDGGQLSIYSEGATWCQPYVLSFSRTLGDRTIFSATRNVDHDPPSVFGCGHSRTTQIPMQGGRTTLTISENQDGTLKFHFDTP